MAKLKSLIKIEGTLDGMTFYKGKDGYLVRTKGGVSKSRIENDPAFVRTRENGNEFGEIAKSGKLLRQTLTPMLVDIKDPTLTARLMKVMAQVKNTDTISVRGLRNVANGLATNEGKINLTGFDFNSGANLNTVLLAEYQLDVLTGGINIPALTPLQQISAPSGATHVGFTAGVALVDFQTNIKVLQVSAEINTPLNNTTTSISAIPLSVPTGSGQTLFLFKMSFYQEINSIQYALNNGAYNVLHILEII